MIELLNPRELLCALFSAIAFVELFKKMPLKSCMASLRNNGTKAIAVMRSNLISDHWKEKALLGYSAQLMKTNVKLSIYIMVIFASFLGTYILSGVILFGNTKIPIDNLCRFNTQIIIFVIGGLYVFVIQFREKQLKHNPDENKDYTFLSKQFHKLVLSNSLIKEMAFDLDCSMVNILSGRNEDESNDGDSVKSPVYITGLARSGTTLILEAIYSTGSFSALTYRDMPLVTAPYIWSKISSNTDLKYKDKTQRAHGDAISVNFDSPEAFEEVFWMLTSHSSYVHDDYLEIHHVDADQQKKYIAYVKNILARSINGGKKGSNISPIRYLSKNNTNTLRIDGIKSAFPEAIILIPFRNPVGHAGSLLAQHHRFLQTHLHDPFSLQYMNWLGHFEFGSNLKPFHVDNNSRPIDRNKAMTIDFWLGYWESVYKYLLNFQKKSNLFFIHYDHLIQYPNESLKTLESVLMLPSGALTHYASEIKKPSPNKILNKDDLAEIPSTVCQVYDALQNLCILHSSLKETQP